MIIDTEQIKRELLDKGYYNIRGFCKIKLLPRKKGKTFVGFCGKEGKPTYSKRVKFTSSVVLKDEICK